MSNPAISEYEYPLKTLGDELQEECIVIAILFVDSKSKFSVLKSNIKEKLTDDTTDPTLEKTNYLKNSEMYIEDCSGKVPISFTAGFNKLSIFCTGTVLGFIGSKNEKNIFICSDVVFPKPINQFEDANSQKSKMVKLQDAPESASIMFISNLLLNQSNFEKTKVLVDYFAEKTSKIVIFGDILVNSGSEYDFSDFNYIFSGVFKEADTKKVLLIPGPNDPTTKLLPQEPFHPLFFDRSLFNVLERLPHPASQVIFGKKFVFINQQIIKDLKRYCARNEDDLEILEQLVQIRQLAPNCPDTLGSVPFFGVDPFLLNDCDYLILGSCSKFQKKQFKSTQLVCIPDFASTKSAVILHDDTNEFVEVVSE